MNQTKLLHCESLGPITRLARPEDEHTLSLDSPALDALTDFKQHHPVMIDCDMLVSDLKQHLARSHARRGVVVDHNEQFVGMLGSHDLEGEKFKRMASLGIPIADIRVGDIMESSSELRAISYAEVRRTTVGDLVASLRHEHCDHFIVVDKEGKCIRGVYSAQELAQRLHCQIEISHAPTFADICHAVAPHLR